MSIDTFMNVMGMLIPMFLFVLGSTWGVVGWLVRSLKQAITERLDSMKTSLQEESNKIAHVEKSLLELKAELPREYVRREDHIRYSAVIEAKIDGQGQALQTLNINMQRLLDKAGKGSIEQ